MNRSYLEFLDHEISPLVPQLSSAARAAFALACAERSFDHYRRWALEVSPQDLGEMSSILEKSWKVAEGQEPVHVLRFLKSNALQHVPDPGGERGAAGAHRAFCSLLAAIDCILAAGDSESAMHAAEEAYAPWAMEAVLGDATISHKRAPGA